MSPQPPYRPSPEQWVRDQVERYESSEGTEGTTVRGRPVVILTTQGVKSGLLRKTPLMRVEHEGAYAIVASQGGAPRHPAWYFNVTANPNVTLRDKATVTAMVAREVTGDEREVWWERAVLAWPDYAEYQAKTQRRIPVIVLEAP